MKTNYDVNIYIAALRRYAIAFGMQLIPFSNVRIILLRLCGVKIGRNCYIGFNCFFDTNYPTLITIGNNVTISHDCIFFTHTVTPVQTKLAEIYRQIKTVNVEDGAWIGARTLILPGVNIGQHCMIGAGSVVTRNTESSALYAGNPCIKIKELEINEE